MKKLLLFFVTLFAYGAISQAQINNFQSASLTTACTNANTTCAGTAGSQLNISSVGFNVASVTVHGTYTGVTLNFDLSDDGGTTWYPTTCTRGDTPTQESSEAVTNSATRQWDCGVFGTSNFRVRNNAITTGSDVIGITLSVSNIEPAPTVSISGGVTATLGAGSNLIGKVGIDQTTPGSTNGVNIAPTSVAGAGIAPVASTSIESNHVLKASAGNLYDVSVTATVAGLIMVFNSTTVPVDGAVTPAYCYPVSVNGGIGFLALSFGAAPPGVFSTGISVAYSTGTNCLNKAASSTAFFTWRVQ